MRLLLDTHVILWSAAEPGRLAPSVAEELERQSNELWFSPISAWEILVLAERGRVSLGPSAEMEEAVRDIFRRIPLREAPLNLEVAFQSRLVKLPQQDPADRFLTATAAAYDLTLVTSDRRILTAGAVSVLPAV